MNTEDDKHLPAIVEEPEPERVDEEAADLALIEKGADLLTKLGSGAHLYHWIDEIGPAAEALRRQAMRRSFSPRPDGRRYNTEMGALLDSHPVYRDLKHEVTKVLWLRDDPERLSLLTYLLAKMSPRQRVRINLPTSAYALINRHMKQKAMLGARAGTYGATEAGAEAAPSPLQSAKEMIRELRGQVAELEERNTHLEGKVDGGGFDFERDSFEDIKGVIDHLPHKSSLKSKVKKIMAAMEAWLAVPAKR